MRVRAFRSQKGAGNINASLCVITMIMGGSVRTTVDLEPQMLIDLKTKAAIERTTVKQLVRQAIAQFLSSQTQSQPVWMRGFGAFSTATDDSQDIQAVIDEEFSAINPADWQ